MKKYAEIFYKIPDFTLILHQSQKSHKKSKKKLDKVGERWYTKTRRLRAGRKSAPGRHWTLKIKQCTSKQNLSMNLSFSAEKSAADSNMSALF